VKDPLVYVEHILRCICFIEKYVANCNKETFSKERMRYDAILRNLQTMSEATQRLPEELKQSYPNIPWKDISGFRNILVHDYLGNLDDDIIWSIIDHETQTN
jgi:uncharacterized protein with HEPN domain